MFGIHEAFWWNGYTKLWDHYWVVIITMLLGGSIIYSLILDIFRFFMLKAFRMESILPIDALMLLDDPDNVSNIVACCIFEKFEHDKIRSIIEGKLNTLNKTRSKLVKVLG